MKQTSKIASTIIDILIDGLNDENRLNKFNNTPGVFMPVSVEFLHKNFQGKYFSVSHYYEQNGDLMRDPEIVFLQIERNNENFYFPTSYRQDNLGIDREYCTYDENGKITGVALRPQADTATFCTMWMKNIKIQQKLSNIKKLEPCIAKTIHMSDEECYSGDGE